jgi:protein TonB
MSTIGLISHTQSTSTSALMRITASILIGATITFSLFVIMYELIKQDYAPVVKQTPFVFITPIFDFTDTPEVQRVRPNPPPELQEVPKSQPVERVIPGLVDTFTNFTPPPIALGRGLTMGSMQMTDKEVTPIFRANPKYPPTEAQNGTQGYVTLSFDVTTSGNVANIQIIDAQPKRVFDRAARQALRKWRYQPKMVSGSAVVMRGLKVRLDFTLDQ